MHDHEAHVRAVEEDLEYYRTKRFEPRVIYFARRGIVTFYDLLKAKPSPNRTLKPAKAHNNMEARIRALEDELDDYVRGISLVSSLSVKGIEMVIEDNRKERGDYDDFFRIAKKEHHGTLKERMERLEQDLKNCKMLLDAFTQALFRTGLVGEKEFRRKQEALTAQTEWSGGRIVARAWVDPEFKANLIARGREAVRELGIAPGRLGKLGVVENTESVHNIKQRIIRDPRGTLEEMFRLRIPPNVEIRVHDSTSDVRYMVLPNRPPDSEAMSEEELAKLVTIDSLIGAGEALHPSRRKEVEGTERVRPVYA